MNGPRAGRLQSLLGLVRRQPSLAPPFDLLAEWGVDLEIGEIVRFWLLAHVSHAHGYLVLTDRRLVFLQSAQHGRYEAARVVPLTMIETIRMPRANDRAVRLTAQGEELAFKGLDASAAARVCEHIRARMADSSAPRTP